MNLELNVVRFNNEDVIATSGVCAHIDVPDNGYYSGHMKVSGYHREGGSYYFYGDEYDPMDKKLYIFWSDDYVVDSSDPTSGVNGDGWYHLENNVYKKCDNQLDAAHPIGQRD